MHGSRHSPLEDSQLRRWLALPLALALGGLLVGLLLAVLPASAALPAAPAVAYPCSQAGLNAALAAGGAAAFTCLAPTTVTVSSAPKLVNKNLSLDGGNRLILSGGGITGVFTVAAGVQLSLLNLTVRDASLSTGAGVYNNGYLAITHSQFISNQAGLGAAVFNAPGATTTITDSTFLSNTASLGGAIFNQSQLQVNGSQFTHNGAGTLVAAQARLVDRLAGLGLPTGTLTNGAGGAIANDVGANLVIGFSAFTDNVALQDGGAIFNDKFGLTTVDSSAFTHNTAQNDSGGAVANLGVFTVTESLFTRNYGAPKLGYLTGGGGAIFSYDGPLFARVAPGRWNGAGGARPAQAPQGGGPATRLFVDHTQFISNSSEYEGGAIDAGPAAIRRSTFLSNTAAFGGALDVLNDDVVVSGSTFIANAVVSTTQFLASEGGAIDANNRAMRLLNSTFYANHAPAGAVGGAIQVDGGTMTVTNSSFISNTAADPGAGGALTSNSNVIARNVLLAYNGGGNCDSVMVLNAHNLEFPGNTCGGLALHLDPLALTPADNGGPTLTSALLPNSPGINAGDDAACPATDQRGGRRPAGAHCDIGAFEFGALFLSPRLWLPLVRK